ncbi:MAG: hypothetical protein EXS36_03605 [Pedosphaera sp.]|nr:hypothetical protein [Pedosphaera sp.]
MKKFIQAAGLLTAAGAASFCHASSLSAGDASRPWSVSAAIKGFYDDNMFAAPKGLNKLDSFGFDIGPAINLNLPLDQTVLTLGYQFNARWFEARNKDEWDLYHAFTGRLSHTFNPRFKLDLDESFTIAQEPEQFGNIGGASVPFRSKGNNMINRAGAEFTAVLTRTLSTVIGYHNNLYDYTDTQVPYVLPGGTPSVLPSYGPILDRIEHEMGGDLRYQFNNTTTGRFGYQYGIYDYSKRNVSDHDTHYIFAGADHSFTSQLQGSIRGGVEISNYENAASHSSDTSPRAEASLNYTYRADSTVNVGAFHRRAATDVILSGPDVVTDAQASAGYIGVHHAITPKLKGSLTATYQFSSYQYAGVGVSDNENYIGIGVGFQYEFTRWLSAEANYYFDDRNSSIHNQFGGSVSSYDYSRNRFFLGVRIRY